MEVLFIELNIHYIACVGSLGYILICNSGFVFFSTQVGLFSSNNGRVHFEGLLHLLRYIRDKKNLGLIYYAKIEDATLSDPLRLARIKYDNQFMVFPD